MSASPSHQRPPAPAAPAAPPVERSKAPPPAPIPEFVLAREKRIALQRKAMVEQIGEVVRAIAFELGNDEFTARVEAALEVRGMASSKPRKATRKRRYTTYIDQDVGRALNAYSKAIKRAPHEVVVLAVIAYLEQSKPKPATELDTASRTDL